MPSFSNVSPDGKNVVKLNRAVSLIQALWRGYSFRKSSAYSFFKHEIRQRRSELYLAVMIQSIKNLENEVKEERKLRSLQLDAIKYLWDEVRRLQQQIKTITTEENASVFTKTNHQQVLERNFPVNINEPSEELSSTSIIPPLLEYNSKSSDNDALLELRNVNKSPKISPNVNNKVESLKDVISPNSNITGSVANDAKQEVTPPTNITCVQHDPNSIILQWNNSATDQNIVPIVAYEIFIDGVLHGVISGKRNKALLEGLEPGISYKISIRSLASLNVSEESNVIEIKTHPNTITVDSDVEENESHATNIISSDSPDSIKLQNRYFEHDTSTSSGEVIGSLLVNGTIDNNTSKNQSPPLNQKITDDRENHAFISNTDVSLNDIVISTTEDEIGCNESLRERSCSHSNVDMDPSMSKSDDDEEGIASVEFYENSVENEENFTSKEEVEKRDSTRTQSAASMESYTL